MATKTTKAARYVPARVRVKLSPGDAVRIARELQEMTQAELSHATGIAQPTLSSIESGRANLGADRAERLAIALKVHPAVLLWPNWEADEARRAAGARATATTVVPPRASTAQNLRRRKLAATAGLPRRVRHSDSERLAARRRHLEDA